MIIIMIVTMKKQNIEVYGILILDSFLIPNQGKLSSEVWKSVKDKKIPPKPSILYERKITVDFPSPIKRKSSSWQRAGDN